MDAQNNWVDVWSTNAIPSNTWTHVAGTLDRWTGTMRVYINGVIEGETNTSLIPLVSLDPFQNPGVGIGNLNAFTGLNIDWQDFEGLIDEASAYNRALSEAEVWGIYNASTNGKFDPFTPRANFAVEVPGVRTNHVMSGANWAAYTLAFTAASNNTVIRLAGRPLGVLLDQVQVIETGQRYYLPEEPLTPMFGHSAFGWWQLELWDNQLGGQATNATLLSWELQLGLLRSMPGAVHLADHVPYVNTNTLAAGSALYFSFDVLCTNGWVTNTFTSAGSADLIFNQVQLPGTGGPDVLLGSFPNGVTNFQTVWRIPQDVLPTRFYLEVVNNDPTNSIILQVDTSCPASTNRSGAIMRASALAPATSGLLIEWTAPPAAEFVVQYTESLVNPVWVAVPGVVRSSSSTFTFLDDGSYPAITDGGTNTPPFSRDTYYQPYTPRFATNRFYRVIQVK
jgi:hypothetical protein